MIANQFKQGTWICKTWKLCSCCWLASCPSSVTEFKIEIYVSSLFTEWLFPSPWNGSVLWYLLLPCSHRQEWASLANTCRGIFSYCWLACNDIVIHLWIQEYKLYTVWVTSQTTSWNFCCQCIRSLVGMCIFLVNVAV